MATIQVREIPEEAYEILRRRARLAGQSIQAYMRDQIVTMAGRQTKDEAVAAIEAVLTRTGLSKISGQAIMDDLDAGRRS
ncbi:MAG: FitA-like ribbon-helix-helix domain-containing protein [Actinomycetota bacterium]